MKKHTVNSSRRHLIKAAGILALAPTVTQAGGSQNKTIKTHAALPRGKFFQQVGDITMYCEVSGQGPLIILQTGAWMTSSIDNTQWPMRPWIDELSKHFTVLTFDARGQGKTTLGQGPISYGRFAADTVRLLDVLGIKSAHFIGHSDGGCVQLDLLLHFSDRVKSSTLVGTPNNHQAYSQSLQTAFDISFKEMLAGNGVFVDLQGQPYTPQAWDAMRRDYAVYSSHPDQFEEVMRQNRRCWATEPNISIKQLACIERPVLVINSGKDPFIPTESLQILAASIPGAERFDIPELTHDISPFIKEVSKAAADFIASSVTSD